MENYMKRAVELAKKGIGFVNPNPLVGAVIVKNGKIIGEGYHERYGHLHAERNALKNCTESAVGAEIYVTLEPCCHYGKNPPCTDALIEAGIKRVYVGSGDPNPLVAGKGIEILRKNGIEVTENVEKDLCDSINTIFFHYITTKTPYVILKTALTIDGKIATVNGHSKWITNELSRLNVHRTRKQVAAIMAGVGTVICDNPMLNCRMDNPSNPVRFILDSRLSIPLDCNILNTANDISTYIMGVYKNEEKEEAIRKKGANVLYVPEKDGMTDIKTVMTEIGKMQLDSVLIEGGAKIFTSAIKSGAVNKLQIYRAPKIIGGDGKNAFNSLNIEYADKAMEFKNSKIQIFGDDILTEYEV